MEKAIKLYPDYALAYYNYAVILYQIKDIENAKKYYSVALRLNPNFKNEQLERALN